MTYQRSNSKPLYRVGCSRIVGQDENGNDMLGNYREIGAVWPRKNGKDGAIMKLDIVPSEITTHNAVIFLMPPRDNQQA